jgi:hypothetical protein
LASEIGNLFGPFAQSGDEALTVFRQTPHDTDDRIDSLWIKVTTRATEYPLERFVQWDSWSTWSPGYQCIERVTRPDNSRFQRNFVPLWQTSASLPVVPSVMKASRIDYYSLVAKSSLLEQLGSSFCMGFIKPQFLAC